MARICLITPFHVAFQPRTVREADSLSAAGHDVRVVAVQRDPALMSGDAHLMKSRGWRLRTLDLRRTGPSRWMWLATNLESRAYRLLYDCGVRSAAVAARAYLRGLRALVRMALEEKADWYIAHTQPTLAVAFAAAEQCGAKVGFDCEDLLADSGTDPSDLVRIVEGAYVRRCAYVTVPSHSIGAVFTARYGISAPVVLYNVFPLRLAEGLLPPSERPCSPRLRLHWFGQTIGPGRGIEEAIDAAGTLDDMVEIHLRGRISDGYASALRTRASAQRTPPALEISPLVDHDQVIRAAGSYDVGLCLERPRSLNAARIVSNKLFSYLAAGLAVAASDTPGQREVLDAVPQAGFVYPSGEVDALAAGLGRWQTSAEALRSAKTAAWNAARTRFCWEREESAFLAALGLT